MNALIVRNSYQYFPIVAVLLTQTVRHSTYLWGCHLQVGWLVGRRSCCSHISANESLGGKEAISSSRCKSLILTHQ